MARLRCIVPFALAASASAQESTPDGGAQSVQDELARLRARVEALEGQRAPEVAPEPRAIDLSGEELPAVEASSNHVLARPWYENIELSGYAAFTYLDTGDAGAVPEGDFLLKEMSLFLDAEVWEKVSVFTEVWVARYLFDRGDQFRLGEIYVQFRDLLGEPGHGLGVKVGRVDIPFGEEYLRWDAPEDPLITFTAADAYGVGEGVEVYGSVGPVQFTTALMNAGSNVPGDPGRLVATRLYGDVGPDVFLSGSALLAGKAERSVLKLGDVPVAPVGTFGTSTAGTSPNADASLTGWELDLRLGGAARRGSVLLQFGRALVDDEDDTFDRDLTWYFVEPSLRLTDTLDLILRYSAIGTYDADEGFLFSGKIVSQGEDLGYDARSLERLSGGLRWRVNPHLIAKAEIGQDRFELIDSSPLDPENDERLFFGFELVASF